MNPLAIFSGPYALLARAAIVAIILLAAFLTGWVKGNDHGTKKLTDYIGKQAVEASRINAARNTVTERVVTQYVKVAGETKTKIEYRDREVIRYVDANLDQCPLTVAWVGLHDSAALNTVPDPARSIDGTASGFTAAQAVPTVQTNYSICHQTADRLRGLQQWVKEQQAVK